MRGNKKGRVQRRKLRCGETFRGKKRRIEGGRDARKRPRGFTRDSIATPQGVQRKRQKKKSDRRSVERSCTEARCTKRRKT